MPQASFKSLYRNARLRHNRAIIRDGAVVHGRNWFFTSLGGALSGRGGPGSVTQYGEKLYLRDPWPEHAKERLCWGKGGIMVKLDIQTD